MKFGIELECYNVTRETVVLALSGVGLNACIASYSGRAYDQWQVKTDCSIQGTDGFEVVSPVLHGEAGIADMRKAVQTLKAIGAKVNQSCGFHVHHDVTDFRIKNFRNLYKRFVKHEAAMDSLMPRERRANANRYIGSMAGCNDASDLGVQAILWKQIEGCRSINQLSNVFSTRYLKLNCQAFFRTGTIEFRHHHGTVNADVVERWVRFTAGMVQQARENDAVRAFTKAMTAEQSLTLMLRMMTYHQHLPREWGQALLKRARAVQKAEAIHA